MSHVPAALQIVDATILSLRPGDVLWVRLDSSDMETLRDVRDVVIRQLPVGVRLVVTSTDVGLPTILRTPDDVLDHPADDRP